MKIAQKAMEGTFEFLSAIGNCSGRQSGPLFIGLSVPLQKGASHKQNILDISEDQTFGSVERYNPGDIFSIFSLVYFCSSLVFIFRFATCMDFFGCS